MGTKADRKGKPNSMSLRRHRKFGGRSGKSPKLRHALKREAEANVVKDKTRISNSVDSVSALFK